MFSSYSTYLYSYSYKYAIGGSGPFTFCLHHILYYAQMFVMRADMNIFDIPRVVHLKILNT